VDVVDTHCHIISEDLAAYPQAPIGGKHSDWAASRPVTAQQMVARMDESGIRQSILVQATTAYGYDNSYVVDSARNEPDRFIAVGTFDPLRPDAASALAEAISGGGLAGVRLFTSGSTMPTQGEWFAAPETYPFWERAQELDVTVCLQMRLTAAKQMESVLERFPRVKVLLDHLGYPDIAGSPARAASEVAALAGHQGLHLKLTHRNLERLQEAGTDASDSFLETVVEAFGAERIAWGSNCPAAEQSLPELLQLAQGLLKVLPTAAREQIFAGTARRLYPSLTKTEG